MLHFGLFDLLAWQHMKAGYFPRVIMNRPLESQSLREFWGERWNRAFRDLTHCYLFGPLKKLVPTKIAFLGVFFVSGVIHELVISWPVQKGYGGPTVFFLLQGLGLMLERNINFKSVFWARLWTLSWVIAPAPFFLFHVYFLKGVVLPFHHDVIQFLLEL